MKKLFLLVLIVAMAFSLAGCAVNATTGSIVVTNNTDLAASNVKVGNVFIGYVGAGTSTTVYFTTAESDAKAVVPGFEASVNDSIDLKLNYQYSLGLSHNSTLDYYYSLRGFKMNDSTTTLP